MTLSMDLSFLRRLVLQALLFTALVACGAAFLSPRWAFHYALVGGWMVGNAVILGTLLWAATASPKRVFTVFLMAPLKIIWLLLLGVYCWKADPPKTAIVAGLTGFFFAVVGSCLYWMQQQALAEASKRAS